MLKMIWKKRKSNALMMLEIFVSFLILFAVSSLSVYIFRNYVKPSGIQTKDAWVIYLNFNTNQDSLITTYKELVNQQLRATPQVHSFSYISSNVPFGFSTMNNTLTYQGHTVLGDNIQTEPTLPATLGIELKAGRWFTTEDTLAKHRPVVLNRYMAEQLFGQEEAVGKILGEGENQQRVVGVVDYYRHKSSFQADESAFFEPAHPNTSDLLVRVSPDADAEFEAKLARSLQQLGKDWLIEIKQLEDMRSTQDRFTLVPILIMFVVCSFLIFNVALGLFGVLFQNISRRRGEIGLRRAIGATQNQILGYFIGETMVIASFGVILGVFFAVQIPLLKVFDVETTVYIWGLVLAVVSIALITVLCAFYPSRQAASIHPATALHEE